MKSARQRGYYHQGVHFTGIAQAGLAYASRIAGFRLELQSARVAAYSHSHLTNTLLATWSVAIDSASTGFAVGAIVMYSYRLSQGARSPERSAPEIHHPPSTTIISNLIGVTGSSAAQGTATSANKERVWNSVWKSLMANINSLTCRFLRTARFLTFNMLSR
jgi:hypothetical protein